MPPSLEGLTRPVAAGPGEQPEADGPAVSTFRSDVQGLRAIAVAAVVAYHLFPVALPGGFVGVDVFFVISGFLITQHLLEEVERTGRIGLTHFWARRIRRLLPAAYLVLGASILIVLVLMPRLTWLSNVSDIGYSAGYIENWLLAIHAIDYLAAADTPTVVQHFWSLGVEEQFYLVWPLALLVAVALHRLLRPPSLGRFSSGRWSLSWTIGVLLALGTLVSFGLSLYLSATRPALAFFATPVRAWEFGVGGLLAVASARALSGRRTVAGPRGLRGVLSLVGLVMVGGAAAFIGAQQPFPGWVAALPVLGALLVLVGGNDDAPWSFTRLTRWRAVQWVGACSYSIYLWHWPLLMAAPWVLHRGLGVPDKLVVLTLTLGLAQLTRRFVEDPVRLGASWRSRRAAYAFAGGGLAALLLAVTAVSQVVDRSNAASAAVASARVASGEPCFGAAAMVEARCTAAHAHPAGLDLAFARADFDQQGPDCQQDSGLAIVRLCAFGEITAPSRTVMVIGNSHALRLIPTLEEYGRPRGWKIILAAKGDCLGLISAPVGAESRNTCHAWSKAVLSQLLTGPAPDAVIFASHDNAQAYLAGPDADAATIAAAQDAVVTTWSSLRARGIPVLVTEDVPGMRPESAPECIARSAAVDDPCAVPTAMVVRPNLMTELAEGHPDLVRYVRLEPYFCDPQRCHALIGGVVVYTDSHHISGTFARTLGRHVGPQVAAAFGDDR